MNPNNSEYSFQRYLAAKKSVDDRALNAQVWQVLKRALADASNLSGPPRVLEIGCGIGTMIERMLEEQMWRQAIYDAIDEEPANIAAARLRLREWAAAHDGVAIERDARLRLWSDRGAARTDVLLEACDAFAYLARPEIAQGYDLIVAHAFLDLVDVPRILPLLHGALKPGGLLYTTINFDGITSFEPTLDPALDDQIEQLYHATMDARITDGEPSGDSRAGRHMIHHLLRAEFDVLAAGASDWLVWPRHGQYSHDEAYFLHFIINTVDTALAGHVGLDETRFASWVAMRHGQIERRELIYLAHQLDILAQK